MGGRHWQSLAPPPCDATEARDDRRDIERDNDEGGRATMVRGSRATTMISDGNNGDDGGNGYDGNGDQVDC